MLETEIEIAAPPSKVRDVFLDNTKYAEWHTTVFKKIESEDTSKSLSSLQPGDKVNCDVGGLKFTATIKENSDTLFQWQGASYGLLNGLHSFHFQSIGDGAATNFRHTESFTGVFAFLTVPSLLGNGVLEKFRQYNKDLKVRVESLNGN